MRQIKAIVTDLDGVLTDGGMYYDFIRDGEIGDDPPVARLVTKRFHTRDASAALWLKQNTDVKLFVITAGDHPRNNAINAERMKVMNLTDPILQGVAVKYLTLNDLAIEHGLDFSEIAYIGDDRIDLECLKAVGFPGCPANALDSVIDICTEITRHRNGEGVSVRNGGHGVLGDLVDKWHRLGYIKNTLRKKIRAELLQEQNNVR